MIVSSFVRSRRLPVVVAVVAVIALGFAVAARSRPHLYTGTVLASSAPAPSLDRLHYADGAPVELSAFDGEAVLLFFGYTNCPDVCPGTLATAARAAAMLSDDARDRVNLVMISVDPDRDDDATLGDYMAAFDPSFRGASGDREAIDDAATAYGIYYVLGAGTDFGPGAADHGDYTVEHTATMLGIAPDGSLRVVWPPDVTDSELAADIEAMLG